jgi:hypothetical protein
MIPSAAQLQRELIKRPCGCTLLQPRDAQTRSAVTMLGAVLGITNPAALLALCESHAQRFQQAYATEQDATEAKAKAGQASAAS